MYSVLKNVQIVIALLKKYNIRHLVLSPGSRNVPFVHSVETDDFFKCYSITDERGAGYFALGLAKELGEPVLISCTSSTASSNYLPAIKKAAEENVQLVALTADRNPYYLDQMENQMINQIDMYHSYCKKSVNLPTVTDGGSYKYCERLVNEALWELDHHGRGPVQINFPAFYGFGDFSVSSLPECRKIRRLETVSAQSEWMDIVNQLKSHKRILLIFGEGTGYDACTLRNFEEFCNKYNCVASVEHMSNISSSKAIRTYPLTECLTHDELQEIMPDLVITFQGNFTSSIKEKLRAFSHKFEHWRVSEDGKITDTFTCLTNVFEMSDNDFFERVLSCSDAVTSSTNEYEEMWKIRLNSIKYPELGFTNFNAIRNTASNIPEGSLLHLSILNSIRMMQFFDLKKDVQVYANVGAYGIDGSFSTFLGQASSEQNKLAYLVIGDLSFFYDINALNIDGIGNNIRIIVINNHGGGEFFNNYTGAIKDIGRHIAAAHKASVESLISNEQFQYCSAENQDELNQALAAMAIKSDKPMLLEVFTDIQTDANTLRQFYKMNAHYSKASLLKNKWKGLKRRLGR